MSVHDEIIQREEAKRAGYCVYVPPVARTCPVFLPRVTHLTHPLCATNSSMRWAGLDDGILVFDCA